MSNYIFSTLLFYNILIFFAFLFNSNLFISILINELIINLTTQETRLLNASNVENVEIELKRTFNYYAKFCLTKNSSINLLIYLIVLFNYNSIIIKTTLTLFIKVFFTNFHESKLYKKTMINTQYKIN